MASIWKTGAVLQPPVRVCFVCSGNICRSPTAAVVLRAVAADRGLDGFVEIDSAGTGDWHAGDEMDERSRATLDAAGYRAARHSARQFVPGDFAERDVVVALDTGHRDVLWWLAAETPDPDAARAKVVMLRAFDPLLGRGEDPDVADPYYGGAGGFTEVLEQIERSCAELLSAIKRAVDSGTAGAQQLAQQPESPPL